MAISADKFVLDNKSQQIFAREKCLTAFDGIRIKWNIFHTL
jgi:hypothetical protein